MNTPPGLHGSIRDYTDGLYRVTFQTGGPDDIVQSIVEGYFDEKKKYVPSYKASFISIHDGTFNVNIAMQLIPELIRVLVCHNIGVYAVTRSVITS